MVEYDDDSEWYYIGESGDVEGPFPNYQMYIWNRKGYFDPDLRISNQNPANTVNFQSLAIYFPEISSAFFLDEDDYRHSDNEDNEPPIAGFVKDDITEKNNDNETSLKSTNKDIFGGFANPLATATVHEDSILDDRKSHKKQNKKVKRQSVSRKSVKMKRRSSVLSSSSAASSKRNSLRGVVDSQKSKRISSKRKSSHISKPVNTKLTTTSNKQPTAESEIIKALKQVIDTKSAEIAALKKTNITLNDKLENQNTTISKLQELLPRIMKTTTEPSERTTLFNQRSVLTLNNNINTSILEDHLDADFLRTMKLKKIMAKAKKGLSFVRQPLQFEPESPEFHIRLKQAESEVQSWCSYCNQLHDHLSAFRVVLSNLTASMSSLQSFLSRETFTTSENPIFYKVSDLAPVLSLTSTLIGDVCKSQIDFVKELKQSVIENMSNIAQQSVKDITTSHDLYESTSHDYHEALATRFSSNSNNSSSSSNNSRDVLDSNVKVTKTKFELARFDYIRKLNGIEVSKLRIVEKMSAMSRLLITYCCELGSYGGNLQSIPTILDEALDLAINGHSSKEKTLTKAREILEQKLNNNNNKNDNSAQSALPISSLSISIASGYSRTMFDVMFQGFLFKKSRQHKLTSTRKWSRRWFVIVGGVLMYMKPDYSFSHVINIESCIIKEPSTAASSTLSSKTKAKKLEEPHTFNPNYSRKNTMNSNNNINNNSSNRLECSNIFEIWAGDNFSTSDNVAVQTQYLNKQKPIIVLQAESKASKDAWILALRARVGAFQHLQQAYPKCSDCGLTTTNLNYSSKLGIGICNNCLATLRSVSYDSSLSNLSFFTYSSSRWTDAQLQLLLKLGNNKVQSNIWEFNVPSQWIKPSYNDPNSEIYIESKEQWFRAKYIDKLFISPVGGESLQEKHLIASRYLYDAVREGDVIGVMKALVWGAQVDWRCIQHYGRTPAHVAALKGYVGCLDLLVSYGSPMSIFDSIYQNPVQYGIGLSSNNNNNDNNNNDKNVSAQMVSYLTRKSRSVGYCPIFFAVCYVNAMGSTYFPPDINKKWFIHRLLDTEYPDDLWRNVHSLYPKATLFPSKTIPLPMPSENNINNNMNLNDIADINAPYIPREGLTKEEDIIYILPAIASSSMYWIDPLSTTTSSCLLRGDNEATVFHSVAQVDGGTYDTEPEPLYNPSGGIQDNGDCWVNESGSLRQFVFQVRDGSSTVCTRVQADEVSITSISAANACTMWLQSQSFSLEIAMKHAAQISRSSSKIPNSYNNNTSSSNNNSPHTTTGANTIPNGSAHHGDILPHREYSNSSSSVLSNTSDGWFVSDEAALTGATMALEVPSGAIQDQDTAASVIHRQLVYILSSEIASPITVSIAKDILNDYKEWSLEYKTKERTRLKQQFIRFKRICIDNDIFAPPLPNVDAIINKPLPYILHHLSQAKESLIKSIEKAIECHQKLVGNTHLGRNTTLNLEAKFYQTLQ